MSGFGGDLVVVLKWGIVKYFAERLQTELEKALQANKLRPLERG